MYLAMLNLINTKHEMSIESAGSLYLEVLTYLWLTNIWAIFLSLELFF